LVKDGSTYYLISDGKKLPLLPQLTSLPEVIKQANAISVSLANYEQAAAFSDASPV